MSLLCRLKNLVHKGLLKKEDLDRINIIPVGNSDKQEDCVNREFIEIVVNYPPADLCIYPKYKGKPYYSIKYRENGEEHVGFGTYKIEILSQWIKEYFISDVQPKIYDIEKEEYGMKVNVSMDLTAEQAFQILLDTLNVGLDDDPPKFEIEDGEIVCDCDDRGELYLALYHLATKIFPNTEFRHLLDDPNTLMSKLYISKEKEE